MYIWLGIFLGMAAGCCLAAVGVLFFAEKDSQKGQLRKVIFPKEFYTDLEQFYKQTEDIPLTLDLLLERYPKGRIARRIRLAKNYLKNSHYKDFETALLHYLADTDTERVTENILQADLEKFRRLPCKANKEKEEQEN